MQVNIKGTNTLEIHKIKIIGLELVKLDEEPASLAGSGAMAKLMPTSNQEDGATSTRVRLRKKYEV